MSEVKQVEPTLEVFNEGDDLKQPVVQKKIRGSDALAEAQLQAPAKPFSKNLIQLYLVCLVGMLCGTMVGIDESIMGSFLVMPSFQKVFGSEVDGGQAAYITSMFKVGAVSSLPFIGEALDRFGRKIGLTLACSFVVLGAILQGTSNHRSTHTQSLQQFIAGRFFLGFGSSIGLAAGPAYVVEISHPRYRGVLTALQSACQNLGGLVGAICTRFTNANYGGTNKSWLIPVWLQMVPTGVILLSIYFIPETPRWNYTHGNRDKAVAFLTHYHGEDNPENAYVQLQIAEFEEELNLEGADKRWWDFKSLFNTRNHRWRMLMSVTFNMFAAVSSGGVSFFFGAFMKSSGVHSTTTQLNYNMGSQIQSFFSSALGSYGCEYLGRRFVLLGALGSITCTWIGMAVATSQVSKSGGTNASAGRAGIAFYFLFNIAYCLGLTPLQGVYASELLSYEMRGKGLALTSFGTNCIGFINTYGSPVAMRHIGYKTYIIWAIWCGLETIFCAFVHVETKGYTLEELDQVFDAPWPMKESTKKRKVAVVGTHVLSTEEV